MLRVPALMRTKKNKSTNNTTNNSPLPFSRRVGDTEKNRDSRISKISSELGSRPMSWDSSTFNGKGDGYIGLNMSISMEDVTRKRDGRDWNTDDKPPQRSLFYKHEEFARFSHTPTLKMLTRSDYEVSIQVEPFLELKFIKIGGVEHDRFKIVKQDPEDDTKLAHNFVWSTPRCLELNERKYRTIIPCVMKFQGKNKLLFDLMVKFYEWSWEEKSTQYCEGKLLNFIQLNGIVDEEKRTKRKKYTVEFN